MNHEASLQDNLSTPKFIRDSNKFNQEDFLLDFLSINFDDILRKNSDLNASFNLCLDQIDTLIDHHLPLRKMTKREIKTNSKPWITPDICNSIKRRDALYRKYLRSKYPTNKNELKE